jgi:hypothetical protein
LASVLAGLPRLSAAAQLVPASKCNGPRQCEKLFLERLQFYFRPRKEI